MHSTVVSKTNCKSFVYNKCWVCNAEPKLWDCPQYKQKTINDRLQFMRQNHLCDNCAKKGHVANYCFSKSLCKVTGCKQKHHPSLHRAKPSGKNSSSATNTSDISENSQSSATDQQQQPRMKFSGVAAIKTSSVYLNVIPVQVSAGDKSVNTSYVCVFRPGLNNYFM